MSTYLFAFVIGKFDHVEFQTKNGVKVRGYTAKGLS
jgi:aminopeptidase N